MKDFITNVQNWASERGIYDYSTGTAQLLKAMSEMGELADAHAKMNIPEMKDAVGEKILLDGIPAIMFLPDYPLERFRDFVRKTVKLFWPRLILGASDEVPPPADIERVRIVSEIVDSFNHEKSKKRILQKNE